MVGVRFLYIENESIDKVKIPVRSGEKFHFLLGFRLQFILS